MARKSSMGSGLIRFTGWLGGRYIKLVHQTSRTVAQDSDPQVTIQQYHPCIIAFWHGQFLLIPGFSPKGMPVATMVARHGDGELIGQALKAFDMSLIRGSGAAGRKRDRGGANALRAAVRTLADGISVPMTADVPPGPARRAGLGIVKLAQLSGRPVVPVAAASSRYHALDTWSRITINFPFSRIGIMVGKPIYVPADADDAVLQAARHDVETELNAVTAKIYGLVGADPAAATPDTALGPEAPPKPFGVKIKAYRLATELARPAAFAILRHRVRVGKEDPDRLPERMGHASRPRPAGQLIWMHAASVGEFNAILPVINGLHAARPGLRVLVTTGTTTSARLAAERLPDGDIHQYLPWDVTAYLSRFLDHWRPEQLVLTESELWPNLITACHDRGIPIVIINGRISSRSQKSWRKHKSFARPLLNRIRLILTQNERLARIFRELGARDARPVGNLKIDAPPLPVDEQAQAGFVAALGGRPAWIAASTHTGEDEIVIAAHRTAANALPGLLTVIAPRHPERGAAIAEQAVAEGLRVRRRSQDMLPLPDTDIYIADTIGELGLFYAALPVAFIGGSLIEHGGQNPIEAIRLDAAVLAGPHTSNFSEAFGALRRLHGVQEVTSAATLADTVVRLLQSPAELAEQRKHARHALDGLSGAMDKTLEALLELIPTRVADREPVDG